MSRARGWISQAPNERAYLNAWLRYVTRGESSLLSLEAAVRRCCRYPPARPPAGPLPVQPGHVLSCQTINNLQISFLLHRAINCVFKRVLGRRVNWKYRANLAKRKNVWKSVGIGGLGKRFYRVVKAFKFSEKADRICFLLSKECPYSVSSFHTSWFIKKNSNLYINQTENPVYYSSVGHWQIYPFYELFAEIHKM